MELALAYQCEEKIGMERLLQYIHYNREANALTINAMGECLHIMIKGRVPIIKMEI